ncbi:MAG TPA: hypothetical protein VN706_16565 [Gemmatimonadaceae bacterium]|jgi:hypothetical protein|nr:hypothetical protein [Gemmatimonadaceae bacterium]
MRRLAVLLFAAVASVASTSAPLHAQTAHPDFTGTWNLDMTKLEPQAAAMISKASLAITQDAKTLKQVQSMTTTMTGPQEITVTYNLDGSDSKNTVSQMGQSLEMTSNANWDGSTLVIKTKAEMQGQAIERTDRYSLDAAGKVLTIDTSASMMGQSMQTKQTFNKA